MAETEEFHRSLPVPGLPEELRREIDLAAAESHHSMNSEMVRRLKLFGQSGSAKLDAEALLEGLDGSIRNRLFEVAHRSLAVLIAQRIGSATSLSMSDIEKALKRVMPDLPPPRREDSGDKK